MERMGYKSSIPAKAREVIHKRYPDGSKEVSHYYVGRKKVGCRLWEEDGQLDFEYGIHRGKKHGLEFRWSGTFLLSIEPYKNGVPHGTARQWSDKGELLITYSMRNGVGLDLWCDNDGSLSEEHYRPPDGQLAYTRWWNSNNRTISSEESWIAGGIGYHGISREWGESGRLRRGFPAYWVNGKKVTRRQYISACKSDSLLPPFRAEDNLPLRDLPRAYLVQRGR